MDVERLWLYYLPSFCFPAVKGLAYCLRNGRTKFEGWQVITDVFVAILGPWTLASRRTMKRMIVQRRAYTRTKAQTSLQYPQAYLYPPAVVRH
jgi:hypothetical protein